ncbi:Uncharacterised protein [Zhongshania aliphaticivorans]|uniref:DMT family transporter n=1 Tax=Zhongshania aliphaticivorans TaxID=1470434 RepID=A0A5S9Q9J4_9GAMM|nr:DMT family transporter [Zhongshania aliphaticivorans]CAA0114729.1 Uncharacterised protein [Zhongshania aliphaticivorans]CAA0123008.1 Uncharacterised protein [Zhongshania aliphaticivorans]
MREGLLFPMIALLIGACIPVQASLNAALSKSWGNVYYPTLVLFTVALLCIGFVVVAKGIRPPNFAAVSSAPSYGYMAGLILVSNILLITYLAPGMGMGNAIFYIVTGQIVAAVIIDHFGMFGVSKIHLSWHRVSGVMLMVLGLSLARH